MSETFARAWPYLRAGLQHAWDIHWRAITKFIETDAEQRAASFAYYALFSIFPLILLMISVSAAFLNDEERAADAIIALVSNYIPVEPVQRVEGERVQVLVGGIAVGISQGLGQPNWFVNVVDGVVHSRGRAGFIASLLLAWGALRFFQALTRGVNKAWGTKEYSWWRLPIKNLFMVGILASALFIGVLIPLAIEFVERYFLHDMGLDFDFLRWLFWILRQIAPTLVLFYGFTMFYRFVPRRRTTFREIWFAALVVTVLLQILQHLFVYYAANLGDFNRLYGTLAGVLALLMWIYLSGSVIIFGACISAAQYEVRMHITDQSESSTAKP